MRTTIASIPMKVAAKPEPGMETNGELKPVASAFASIVFPVPGAPRKSKPRSRFPPARSNASPDCQIETTRRTSSFASACPRTSASFDAPLRVARLEGLDLREVHEQERAEEDREVHDHVEGEDHEERAAPGPGSSAIPKSQNTSTTTPTTIAVFSQKLPEPDATARDDVLLAELHALEPEEARPRDDPVEAEVGEAADADDEEQRGRERPVPRPALRLVEPDEDGRGGQQGDEGRGARELAPLTGELAGELALLEPRESWSLGRHP